MSCIDLFFKNNLPDDFDVARSPEQINVIKYFHPAGGCIGKLFKTMSDALYRQKVAEAVSKITKEKALEKIGLDESQVSEIEPVHFENFYWDEKNGRNYSKWIKKDHEFVSSAYQITWIFFGDTQMYVYQYLLNMDRNEKKESTEEYFYKDVTNFSTSSDTVEQDTLYEEGGCLSGDTYKRQNVNMDRFQISAMGDKFWCSMRQNEYSERAIQGMKAKLREKKNQ